jgi:hypothetical protein
MRASAVLLGSLGTVAVTGSLTSRTVRLVNACNAGGYVTVTNGYGSTSPVPSTGTFYLPANGSSDLIWPAPYPKDVVWSGNVGLCVNSSTSPQCAGTQQDCDAGKCGMTNGGPNTRAEFTLSNTGDDFYDVTVINGLNIAVSISPSSNFSGHVRAGDDPYTCGSPGATTSITPGGANSTWDLQPPSEHYYWVLAGGPPCASIHDCDTGLTCGLSRNIGNATEFQLTCGVLLGHWTGDEVCGDDQQFGAPFNCSQPVQHGPTPNSNMWTYYGCVDGIASCYSDNAPSTCCGCVNWWEHGLEVPPSPLTQNCTNVNPEWVGAMLPRLLWLKAACPSCYTYPFDDMSSTFVCSDMQQPEETFAIEGAEAVPSASVNVMDYEVTFCSNNLA